MKGKNKQILIIGAGPAGLACAMELYKSGYKFTVVEKDKQVGGLSKTYKFGEFRTDNGPHRFFSKNQYLYNLIEDLIKEKWIKVNRFTRFYVEGKYYLYPIEWKNALKNVGLVKAVRVIIDLLYAKIKYRNKQLVSYEEFVLANFGKSLAELNMLSLNQKIWGLSCSELSVDWGKQRIRGLSFRSLLSNILFKKEGPKTLVDAFYYPSLGAGLVYEEITKRIKKGGSQVLTSNQIMSAKHKNSRIAEVVLKDRKKYKPKYIVSSMPITSFVKLLDPPPSKQVIKAANNLKFRSGVYLFITIDKPQVTPDQWVYFPDLEIPFFRMSEMKNFSKKMSPDDKTSLFLEFNCWEGDDIWNMSKKDLFEKAIEWLEKMDFVKRKEVIDVYKIKQNYIYPVYDLNYRKNLDIIKRYLDRFKNLIYIGRPGRFKYTNQDHSLEMGILAAKGIIEGKRVDVEDVGAEKEYFEKGYVR